MKRRLCLLLVLAGAPAALAQSAYRIETVAGSGRNGDGGSATAAQIGAVQGIAADRSGNLYISDTENHRVRKVSAAGIVTTIAGTGTAGFAGDGGPASQARLNLPYGLAVDVAGILYIADLGNNRVRRVGADGRIATIAGLGAKASTGDGGPALEAQLFAPRNLAVDAAGGLYLSEFEGHRVRRISPDGRILTVAGSGTAGFAGDGAPAAQALLNFPAGLALDGAGSLYIADSGNGRIRRVTPSGAIVAVGGQASAPSVPVAVAMDAAGVLYVADGRPAVGSLTPAGLFNPFAGDWQAPRDLAIDATGNLLVADGMRVRRVDPRGPPQTVAGDAYTRVLGDGGPATAANLWKPSALAMDAAGRLLIADSGTGRIRQVARDGSISTLAGGPDAAVALNGPMGVAVDAAGVVYIADTAHDRVLQLGPGPAAPIALPTVLHGPRAVCAGPGVLYIVDSENHRVLRVAGARISTVAEEGLNLPSACAADAQGNLYIADTNNHRVVKVSPDGAVATLAGTGTAGFDGDGGPAAAARLRGPMGVAAGSDGTIYIGDTGNNRIRRVAPGGTIQTVAVDDAAMPLNAPAGLWLDGAGVLYIADTGNNLVRRLVSGPAPIAATTAWNAVNAASLLPGAIAPGELLTLYGSGLGPAAGVKGEYDGAGMLPTRLGEVEVRFDGAPAPLLYAQAAQVNVQAPYAIAGRAATRVEVFYRGLPVGAADLPVVAAAPALFGPIADAAARGSVISLYATGAGLTDGDNVTGQLAGFPLVHPRLPVSVSIGGMPAEVLFAGSAPGLVGTLQVNVRVPGAFLPPGTAAVELSVGAATAPAVAIAVR